MPTTLADARRFRQTGRLCSCSECLDVPAMPSFVSPPSRTSMDLSQVPRPTTPQSYNRVPLKDVSLFGQFRYSDPLHRADAVAKLHSRAGALSDRLVKDGVEKFINNYSN